MRPAIVAGLIAVALGVVSILDRGIAGLFDLDYLFVTLVGVLSSTAGLYYLNRRRSASRETAGFDAPERRYRVAVPGDDLDEQFETISMQPRRWDSRRGVRERLRETAIRALVVHAGYDPATARDAVESGEWTDDPAAASFLADNSQYPPRLRLKALFGRIDLSTVGARRTVEAISAVMEP